MKFTTPCFVRIKSTDQREKLITWLEHIGYDCSTARTDVEYYGKTEPVFMVVNGGDCRIQHNRPMLIEEHDCGTDIELFKALAAMNDDNCREQWFVSDCLLKFERLKGVVKTEHGKRCLCRGEWFKVLIDEARDIRAAWIGFRRPKSIAHCASVEEIIEHFKNRKG